MKHIARRVRRAYKKSGLTQIELTARLGISLSTLYKLFAGTPIRNRAKMARVENYILNSEGEA